MDDDVVLTVADSAVEPGPTGNESVRRRCRTNRVVARAAAPERGRDQTSSDAARRRSIGAAALPRRAVTDGRPRQAPADEPRLRVVAAAADVVAGEPVAEWPQASAEEPDAIAMQVEQDLDQLADAAPVVSTGDAAPATAGRSRSSARLATAARADEPADFLLEAPAAMPADHAPMSALVASAQATRAQLSNALAAIETELFGRRHAAFRPHRRSHRRRVRPSADGPLAALMLMSEEERLALFS